MEKQTLNIPNITCNHCVMSIKSELAEIEGIQDVEGDAASKNVTVEWDAPATLEQIKAVLEDINYPAG
jgi:copper chaperone